MKKFLNEFKEFAVKGNMIDLAVGMIIGSAFTAVVNSLVNDVFMPLLGVLTLGYVDFARVGFYINKVYIPVGSFLTAVVKFIALAFAVFLFVKFVNKLRDAKKKPEVPAAPTTKICPFCKSEVAIDAVKCPHCTSDLTVNE